jgi:hypothetical protein
VDGRVREAIDPDDFSGGFAVWSGTSFAAPLMAGHIVSAMRDELVSATPDDSRDASVKRGWAAVSACTPLKRPQ